MIDLSYWPTPNGHKVTMFLEEAEVPYRLLPVNLTQGEQFQPDFLRISPNNKMPAIVDTAPSDGGKPLALFESGAILEYLGMKTGRFLPTELRARANVMQWLFWQMGGLGPMLGQNHHFAHSAPEKIPYAIDRYVKETARLYRVLDTQLAGTGLCGRHLLHCGHGLSPVDCLLRPPEPEVGGLPQREALVRGHRRAAGCPTRLCTGQRRQRLAPGAHRGGAKSALRPGATPSGGALVDGPSVEPGEGLVGHGRQGLAARPPRALGEAGLPQEDCSATGVRAGCPARRKRKVRPAGASARWYLAARCRTASRELFARRRAAPRPR